jgi:type I restriction enzyme S subunit
MNNQWKKVELGEVLTLQRGHDLPSHQREFGAVPIVSSSGITDYHNEAKANPPGVVTGRYGTIGEVFYIDKPYWPLNTALYVKDFKGNNAKFISYVLESLNLKEMNAAGAVPGVNRNHLHKLKFLFPINRLIQDRIAAFVSTYEDLIENNLKRIKLLEEMAQITYEEWFVRMKFPGYETAIIDEETGLPEGWNKGSLSDLVSFLNGYAFKSEEFVSTGFGVIKIKNIEGGNVETSNVDKINEESSVKAKKFQLLCGDKVIAMTGATVGKVGLIPSTEEPLYLNQRVGKLVPLSSGDNTFLAYCFLEHDIGYQQVINMASGAAQPNISGEAILSAKSVIPTKDLLNKFEVFGTSVISQILNLRSQNNLLTEARDILLPRLITGMIDIDQVELPEAILKRLEQQKDEMALA